MSDSKQFNPYLARQISDSKGRNYGHVFGDMFNNLGQNKEDAVKAENEKVKNEINKTTLDIAKDKVHDNKAYASYVNSDYADFNTWSKDNDVQLKTPEMIDLAEKTSDKKLQKVYDESLADHEKYLKENNLFLDKSGNVNLTEVRKQLSKDPQNLYLAEAFERKYGSKLNKPAKELTQKDKYDLLKTESTILKNQAQTKKINNEINNPDKYSPTIMQKEYRAEMKSKYGNDEKLWEPIHEYATKYRQSKKMTGEATYNTIINGVIDDYSKKLETEDFSNIDFNKAIDEGKITPNEKRKLERNLASTREAKNLESQYGKYKADFETIAGQAERFAKYANSKSVNTDVIQNATDIVKSYIPDLDPSDEDVQNFEFRSDFLNLSSTILKLQSGLTVTDKEREQFNKSMGTLSKNKKVNFIGLKQKILDRRNALSGIKNTAPEYFNIKYGDTLRNIDDSIVVIDNFLKDDIQDESTNKTKVLFDMRDKKENTQEQTTTTQGNKPAWRNYE